MNNQQILETAIQKAIDGGWKQDYKVKFTFLNDDGSRRITAKTTVDDWDTYASIIFNHDFAKALWEDVDFDPTDTDLWEGDGYTSASFLGEAWQFHIQNMVIADDPIEYLGENL